MKTTSLLAAALVAATAATVTPAAADWVDQRQRNQMERIEDGYRAGQLTRSEYYRLIEQQREIARLERLLERDGRLSPSDRVLLSRLQNEASRDIFWQRRDGETRYDNRGWGWGRGWGRGWGQGWGWNRGHHDNYDHHAYGRRWYQWY